MNDREESISSDFTQHPDQDVHALKYMLDTSLDIICTIDKQGRFRYLSKSCYEILGYRPEELIGKQFIELVHQEDVRKTQQASADIQQGKNMTNFENRYLRKDGTSVPIMWSAKWDEKTNLMYCVAKDATDIKKLEAEKDDERNNKEALINLTDTRIWSFDENLKLISANKAFKSSVKDYTGKSIEDGQYLMDENFFGAAHTHFWRKPYKEALNGKATQIELEVPSSTNTDTIWLKTEIKPIKQENRIKGAVCRTYDITNTKKNALAVKELNEKLHEAQSFAKLGYWELDQSNQSIFWSDEIYKIWEKEKTSFQTNYDSISATIHPNDLASYQKKHQNALKDIAVFENLYYRIITNSGEIKWIREIASAKKDNKNSSSGIIKGIVQDVTQQKEIELELKKRNAFIESIFHHVPMGIAVNKIREGTALMMNNEFSNIYGWPSDELTDIATFFNKIYPELNQRAKMVKRITADLERGDTERMHWKDIAVTTKDGKKKYVDAKNIPLPEQNIMISTAMDVTDKVKNKLALEKALKERNVILESISDAFYALNNEYEFTYLNQTALKVFNKTAEELLGKKVFQVFPELKNTVFYEYLQKVKDEHTACSFEFYDKQYNQWYDENIYTTQEGYSVFFKDITDRKKITWQLQKAYERNQEILESISDAFYALDRDFNFIYFNTEAEKLLKISRSEALGKNKWQLFKDTVGTKLYNEYLKALELNETRSFDFYYSPLKKWFHINAYPSENGLSIYFRDISDQKRHRKNLEKLNKELQFRAHELEQINLELEQFAFIASHDLQEPLRMITSFMAQLKNKYGAQLDEKAHTYMNFAIDGGSKMREIIIDLLEYSRAGSNLECDEEMDLNKVVNEVITLHRGVIYHKKAQIAFEDLPMIRSNKIGVQQVLNNLISNALKYSKEGVVPKINISCQEFKKEFQITISDNGIGIKKEHQDKIFVIFQRLHPKDQLSGSGIGLAICKKIVEKAKGKIWVESELGKYSNFHFTIPKQ